MIKGIILGILLTVGAVGYDIVHVKTIAAAGDRVKNGVDYLISSVDDATK